MDKVTPFLWFDDDAEEAVNYYVAVFDDATIGETTRYGEGSPGPVGQVMTIAFELFGRRFTALNGGPEYRFTPAISFVVDCDDQAEIDRYWEQLSDGGEPGPCGWLVDRFGVSWQIVPRVLPELLQGGGDASRARRVMETMLAMGKLEIEPLQRAYDRS